MTSPQPLSHRRPTPLDHFYYGVAYYPEHWPEADWEHDAQRMVEMGVNLVRIAEFAWNVMEPAPGVYDFSLFDRSIALLAEHGISVMLCTPTATPPRWLTVDHPDMLRVDETGRSMHHGSRQHISHMHAGFREHSQRITRAMAEHFRDSPTVVGWQTDNEFHCHFSEDHSEPAQRAFAEWCRSTYDDDIAKLNQAWGTVFWSNQYDTFEQLLTPRPKSPTHLNPAHVLDYKRFLSDAVADFQHDQVVVLREVNPAWWITHNGVFENIDFAGRFTEDLDFLSFDNYPMFIGDYAERCAFDAARLDRVRALSGNFFIPEQQGGAGGQTDYRLENPAPGEMRQMAMRAVARGADGLLFFRWRTALTGAEQHWLGVIDADNVGRRRYDEAKKIGQEFRRLGPELLGSHVHADALIAGGEYRVAAGFEACHLGLDRPQWASDVVHQSLFNRGLAVGVARPADDLSDAKLFVIPHWTLFDPAWVEPLQAWVEAGGTLVVGAMTGTRDMNNNLVELTPPGVLAALAGVTVTESARVNDPKQRPLHLAFADGDAGVHAEQWCETLEPQPGTDVLARWTTQWFADEPAITSRRVGDGRVVYVGTYLTAPLCEALWPALLPDAGLAPLVPNLPADIEVVQRRKDDQTWTFLINNREAAVTLDHPPAGHECLTDQPVGDTLDLPAHGVAVVRG